MITWNGRSVQFRAAVAAASEGVDSSPVGLSPTPYLHSMIVAQAEARRFVFPCTRAGKRFIKYRGYLFV